jgi:RsbT co-antagonist protein rsbRD N-terminal domain
MLGMQLSSILADKKASILKKWFDEIVESYPSGVANYLKNQGDKFTNPIGSTISKGIEDIFVELIRGPQKENTSKFLGNIVRVIAIQNIPASQALSFFFSLKRIIREELRAEMAEQELSHEILSLESTIDSLALSAFDIFMECREKIYEIKVNEVKRANFRFLQRANLINAADVRKAAPEGKNNLKIKEER